MSEKYVQIDNQQGVVTLTINRPPINVIDTAVLGELHTAVDTYQVDESIIAMILTGTGNSFVGGADLQVMTGLDRKGAYDNARWGQEFMDKLEHLPFPVIAAVNGTTMGGGCEVVWGCDLRICTTDTIFMSPESRYGFSLGWGGSQRLPQMVGRSRAMEMMLLAEAIDAQKALDWGLVNRVVPRDELMTAAYAMAAKIGKGSRQAIKYMKKSTVEGYYNSGRLMDMEAEYWGYCFASGEPQNRIRAFLARLAGKK